MIKGVFYSFSVEIGQILCLTLSMFTTPIYIINHVNFWPPSPRGATKKIRIKCAFLLTQTENTLKTWELSPIELIVSNHWTLTMSDTLGIAPVYTGIHAVVYVYNITINKYRIVNHPPHTAHNVPLMQWWKTEECFWASQTDSIISVMRINLAVMF